MRRKRKHRHDEFGQYFPDAGSGSSTGCSGAGATYAVELIEFLVGQVLEFFLCKRRKQQIGLERTTFAALVHKPSDLCSPILGLSTGNAHWSIDIVESLTVRSQVDACPLGLGSGLGTRISVVEVDNVRRERQRVWVG